IDATPAADQNRSGPNRVHLFTIPGSHPGVSVQRMLEYKDIPYKRTDLLPVVSWAALKARRFPGVTVPAIKIDGRRFQGSLDIARELERIKPEPPLYPADPAHRARVGEVERFGDEELQRRIRRPLLWMFGKNTAVLASYLEGAKIHLPHGLAAKTAGPFVALDARSHEATDENVRRDISLLPAMLQRIDDWIAEGVIGGGRLNAADFQIGPSLRLAMSLDDLRPAIENRPAGELAVRVVPDYPGRIPPVLPPAWLEPLHDIAV
ncbi:MAG: glutathione S-transferase N-terminal domain-containing protein, partial [Acidobacteriota bacterium]